MKESIREIEVRWYRENGKYIDERITIDANDNEYMIGDWSWNRDPKNKHRQEFVEPVLLS